MEAQVVATGCFQQNIGAIEIGPDEGPRILNGVVVVRLSRKMDDGIDMMLADGTIHGSNIADIGVDHVDPIGNKAMKVIHFGRIGEQIVNHDARVRMVRQHIMHKIRADEPGSPSDHQA